MITEYTPQPNAHVWAYREHQSKRPTRVTIGTGAAALLREIADANNVTPRHLLESLLNFAGSVHHRPGSWEAQGFDLSNYGPDGCADRWFS